MIQNKLLAIAHPPIPNLIMIATTNAKIMTDSANAIAKIMFVWIAGVASGFLPIDSIAFDPISPMAIAGAIEPIPIAIAVAIAFADASSIKINNF
jgi:hypothetical protein